jgi:hypothetical protein
MNEKQVKTRERLLEWVRKERLVSLDGEVRSEIKDIRDHDMAKYGAIGLGVTIGLIGDEGTAAEVWGRTKWLWLIGPRGGLKTFDGKRWLHGWANRWHHSDETQVAERVKAREQAKQEAR